MPIEDLGAWARVTKQEFYFHAKFQFGLNAKYLITT
jgi:hypothetical protein